MCESSSCLHLGLIPERPFVSKFAMLQTCRILNVQVASRLHCAMPKKWQFSLPDTQLFASWVSQSNVVRVVPVTWQYRCWYCNERQFNTLLNQMNLYCFCYVSTFTLWRNFIHCSLSLSLSFPQTAPISCCLLATRLADQIWTSPLSVRPATSACSL